MKFDNTSSASAITSAKGITQISTLALTSSIATATFVIAFLTYASILIEANDGQAVPSVGKVANNNIFIAVSYCHEYSCTINAKGACLMIVLYL